MLIEPSSNIHISDGGKFLNFFISCLFFFSSWFYFLFLFCSLLNHLWNDDFFIWFLLNLISCCSWLIFLQLLFSFSSSICQLLILILLLLSLSFLIGTLLLVHFFKYKDFRSLGVIKAECSLNYSIRCHNMSHEIKLFFRIFIHNFLVMKWNEKK